MNTDERCDWSDLLVRECSHCGARPGDGLRMESPRVPRATLEKPDLERTLERPSLPATWAPANDSGECRCGAPTRDSAWLCDDCQTKFRATLADLSELDDEITTTITRQRAASTTGSAPSAETPLPWHEKAATARRTLHGLLVLWVRFCDEEKVRGAGDLPDDTIPALAAWLTECVHGLALLDIGPEAVDEITDAAAECHRLVFWKRKNRLYLGPCRTPIESEMGEDEPCPGEVYADEGEPIGYCDLCEQGATVVIRRAELERDLDRYLATAAEIARLATYLGLDVPRDQVRKRVLYWHRHKRIEVRGTDVDGFPMFRYGEVRGMLYGEFATRAS